MKAERFEYVVDSEDVIVAVNSSWADLAEENDGEGCRDRFLKEISDSK